MIGRKRKENRKICAVVAPKLASTVVVKGASFVALRPVFFGTKYR